MIISLHQANLANQREFMQDTERQSANAVSNNEDVFLKREFSRTIHERSLPHARTDGIDPSLSQRSTHTAPSSVANTSPNLSRQASPFSDAASSRWYFQQPLRPMFNAKKCEIVDEKWSMALSVMGLPFKTLAHPSLKEAINFLAKLPGYKLPSTTALRTNLLDKTYAKVKKTAEENIWDHNFCVRAILSCDGWTNRNGRPQMNIMFINRYGEMLHAHADGSNMTKDAKWMSGHILKAIKKVDPKNVLQFTADNASINILAGKFVRAEYPHIVFGGCVAHGIDLLFEDMGKLAWISAIFDKCYDIVSFIKNSHQPHTMLMDFFSDGATLLKPGVTRFATNIIMLDRMYHLQHCLKKMVVSEQWTTWETYPRPILRLR
ncbi:hypothetical protein R1flu_017645 [Riccia fluitans]|uniref:DUF659 domain-containing protein n=1 Tax=Riccia fluitans TaxID=41844 RepID=A0ABD1ZDJ2_9MARC